MEGDPAEVRHRESWSHNAVAWADAVRERRIASRREVTNEAVLSVLRALAPATALDVGCGEGWLTRELTAWGVDAWGVDGCPELVELAREAGGQQYAAVRFEELTTASPVRDVDVIVANFALNTKAAVPQVLAAASRLLRPGGHIVVQTVHPMQVPGAYVSGWRPGSWDGFGDAFVDPAPWFFRTLGDWVREVGRAGLELRWLEEPLGAEQRPRSLMLVARAS